MLFSSIKNASHNDISSERFQRALAWLATTDMSAIECGRHDIVGDEVFANVMEFTTVPAAEKNYEAWVTLHGGDIVVTPPEDAHKPGCSVDEPAPLKKICVKVLVD